MPELLLDESGLPEPQYKAEDNTRYETQKGRNGAAFKYTRDGENETLGSKADVAVATGDASIVAMVKNLRSTLASVDTRLTTLNNKLGTMPSLTDTVKTQVTNTLPISVAVANPTETVLIDSTIPISVAVSNPVETVTVANPVTEVTVGNTAPIAVSVPGSVTVANPVTDVGVTGTVAVSNMPEKPSTMKAAALSLLAATATELTAGVVGRQSVEVYNAGTVDLFIGFDDLVTAETGFPIKAGTFKKLEFASTVKVYGIAAEALDVRIIEG